MSSKFIPGYAQETEMLKQHYRRIRKLKEQARINEALNDTLPEGSTESRKPETTSSRGTGNDSVLLADTSGDTSEAGIYVGVHNGGDLPG